MKKIKKIEKKLYSFIENADHTPDTIANELLRFWEHYDALFHTNHYQILKALASPVHERYTAEGLALLFNLSDRTLLRYRKLYIESYMTFCQKRGVDPSLLAE